MKAKSFLIAVFLIIASLPAVYQIVTPGYFPIHDDTQVARVYQMYKALSAGQFPVRWVPDLGYGYGYPIFNFYNPLPYYFGAIFTFLGLDALTAAKIMFVFPVILSGLTIYLFSRLILPRWGALLAAILYVYAPYHAVQVYVRGAVAEYWAYAILPLVFYAVWKNKIILGGISLAALITSHNLTAFMSAPFLLLIVILKPKAEESRRDPSPDQVGVRMTATLILGLGLSAFFWLPALVEINKTQVSQMVFEQFDPPAKHLITFNQLWSSTWGYGGSSPSTDDGLSLQLGKVQLLGSALALILFGIKNYKGYKKNKENNLISYSIIGILISIFLILPSSTFIWNSLPLLSYIQFPWRFLTFASLFSSILAAWATTLFFGRTRIFALQKSAGTPEPRTRALATRPDVTSGWEQVSVVLGLTSLFIFFSLKFFQPQFKYPTSATELTSRERILWEVSRRSDEYLPKGFVRPNSLEEALRIDNPSNQILADKIKQPTKIRQIANFISLLTLIALSAYTVGWKFRKLPVGSLRNT